jgi:hypothetical protein
MGSTLRLAMGLTMLPTLLGALLVGWFVWQGYGETGTEWYQTVWIGLVAGAWVPLGAGFVCLCWYRSQARAAGLDERRIRRHSVWTWALLLLNGPAFLLLYAISVVADGCVHVWLHNQCPEAVDELTLLGPGIEIELGGLPAGSRRYCRAYPQGDGTLRLLARSGATPIDAQASGYVTPNSREEVRIFFVGGGRMYIPADSSD